MQQNHKPELENLLMRDYIELNKQTYNELAEEYFSRLIKYDISYHVVGEKICETIFNIDSIKTKLKSRQEIKVLELGCGPGAILQALKDYPHVKAYAVDFSDRMAFFAKKSNEEATIKVENILDVNDIDDLFGEKLQGSVDVLIMAAFIHLFPRNDAEQILQKAKNWISYDGIIYLDTTEEKEFSDGQIRVKKKIKGRDICHFRTMWTRKDFNTFLTHCGYDIILQREHLANNGKKWLRTIIRG